VSPPRAGDDRGSATVQAVVLATVIGVLAAVAAAGGGLLVAQRRAGAAADLAALAAAAALASQAGTAVCGDANRVSRGNGAELTRCDVRGHQVSVEVEIPVESLGGVVWEVPGRARAGPVDGVSSVPVG
jgi:secretion/DNA translocation related TadE-like protein